MVNVRCPNCQATYQLDPAKLADGGRKLKCAKCGTVWVARAEETSSIPVSQTISPPAVGDSAAEAIAGATTIHGAADPDPQFKPQPEATPASQPETAPVKDPEPDLPPPDDLPNDLIQRSPNLEELTQVGGWHTMVRGDNIWRTGAVAFILLGLAVGGLVLWSILGTKPAEQEAAAKPLPETAMTEKVVQPPEGVVLHRVRGDVAKTDGKDTEMSLTVRGLLTNTTSATIIVPPMRLELLGKDGKVADMWPVTDISSTLMPAAEQAWSVSLSAPDMTTIRGWRVVFIAKSAAPAAAPAAPHAPTTK